MDNKMLSTLRDVQLTAQTEKLRNSNETAERYGLSLSEPQINALILSETESLHTNGRLEFGEGILPRLIYTFCDSPYMTRENWADSLQALAELFYIYKNDLDDALTDDELLEAMYKVFHGRAQGSFLYLENMTTDKLLKALRSDGEDEDEDDEIDD